MQLEHTTCNLCGRDDTEIVFEQQDALTSCPVPFAVVKCRECGLVYVNPRPSMRDIASFYPKDYIAYQFELFDSDEISVRERLLSYITRSAALQRVRFVDKVLELDAGSKVLDVGCGKANFLYFLHRKLGCEVTGLDFDETSIRYCRETLRINALHGNVDSLEKLGATFDLITMWHFLEHDFDPLSTLCRINDHLGENGFVIFEVPNADSLENRIFGSRSFLYDVPRHLYDFSPDTIRMLLEKAGFELQSISYPCFSGGWVGSVQNVLLQGRMYRRLKDHVFLFMLVSQVLYPVEFALRRSRRGSIMAVVARKAGRPIARS